MQSTSPLTSETAPTVRSPASGGGKLGRVMFPLLLVLLPAAADAAFVQCASGNCGPSPSFTQPSTFDEAPADQQLEFPFPLGTSTFSGSGSSGLSLGFEEGAADEDETLTEEEGAEIPSGGTTTKKAPIAASQAEAPAAVQAPAGTAAPFPQVGPATTGERATRNYRTYETPAPRRIYDHPSAGGAGRSSSFPATAGSQSSIPSSSSTSSSPAPPPPPPPGQGSPGTFAPGEPGELAGFIG